MRLFRLVVILTGCCFVLLSCRFIEKNFFSDTHVLPNDWDGGLFSQQPCKPPCFANIFPGTTTEAMLTPLLQDETRFQNCTLEDQPNQGRWVSCKGMIITFKENSETVDAIGFKISQEAILGDVIQVYGEPTAVWVVPEGVPEHPATGMCVFLGDSKIRLDIQSQQDMIFLLDESSPITNIVYYSEPNTGMDGFIQDWQGYGEYTASYNGN